jgi:hypothetical protein
LLIAGAVLALLGNQDPTLLASVGGAVLIGGIIAVVGVIFIIIGFVFTSKKRDSVLAPVDTRKGDTPPPPPPPD